MIGVTGEFDPGLPFMAILGALAEMLADERRGFTAEGKESFECSRSCGAGSVVVRMTVRFEPEGY